MPETSPSMFEQVKEYKDRIEKLEGDTEQLLKDHETLLKGHNSLFAWKKQMEEWKKDSDTNFQDLKLTIMQENKETRTFFQTIMSNQWDLIKAKDTLNEAEKARRHELNKVNTEIKRDNYSKAWDIIKIALGSTGIVYILMQAFLK